jgi:NAD(P)H-dependent FMN reductase
MPVSALLNIYIKCFDHTTRTILLGLNTAVVYGSARQTRQGIKAARFIVRKLEERDHAVTLVDSRECELPFLDLMYKEYEDGQAPEAMETVAETFRSADGFIIVSAEYNHSIPAALKNLLDYYQSEYLYKPSAIVTYSAGPFGGVRALINLRAILAELGTPSIPSAFPVSHVGKAFDNDGNPLDQTCDKRVIKFLDEYEWYANALTRARSQDKFDLEPPAQQQMCRGNES